MSKTPHTPPNSNKQDLESGKLQPARSRSRDQVSAVNLAGSLAGLKRDAETVAVAVLQPSFGLWVGGDLFCCA